MNTHTHTLADLAAIAIDMIEKPKITSAMATKFLQDFTRFLNTLQPETWEEMRQRNTTAKNIFRVPSHRGMIQDIQRAIILSILRARVATVRHFAVHWSTTNQQTLREIGLCFPSGFFAKARTRKQFADLVASCFKSQLNYKDPVQQKSGFPFHAWTDFGRYLNHMHNEAGGPTVSQFMGALQHRDTLRKETPISWYGLSRKNIRRDGKPIHHFTNWGNYGTFLEKEREARGGPSVEKFAHDFSTHGISKNSRIS
jgi:hypothetical protein